MAKKSKNGPSKTIEESETWDSRQDSTLKEAVILLGTPLEAVKKLASVGRAPIDVAIVLAGGVGKTAEAMGVSRSVFNNMRDIPVGQWKLHLLERLGKATGIPYTVLKLSAEDAVNIDIPQSPPEQQDHR